MTRDESLEAAALVHHAGVVIACVGLARLAHAALVLALPGLKPPVAPGAILPLLALFLPLWVFAAERVGLHRIDVLTGPRSEAVRRVLLTQAWALVAAALILVGSQTALNRSLIAVFFGLSTALLLLVSWFERRLVARRRGGSRILIVGPASGQAIADVEWARGRRAVWEPAADSTRLEERLRAEPVDEVLLAPGVAAADVRPLIEQAADHGVTVLVPLSLSGAADGLALPAPRVQALGSGQVLVYARTGPGAAAMLVKTVVDRLLAAVLLIVLGPLMVAIAAAVRLRLGSPVLFMQRRTGFHGQPFWMFKFRSMRVGADAEQPALRPRNQMDGPVFKLADDPRVTPFGRFLRRSSLDELPQLLNVLAGQMSLVGPRPLPVGETALLNGGHRRRLSMRPGLTCLWQVSGRNDLSFREWMALDLDYVDRWSLGLDAAILLRTIPAVVTGRGAR